MATTEDCRRALRQRVALASMPGMNVGMARELTARVGSLDTFFETPGRVLQSIIGVNARILSDEVRTEALRRADQEMLFLEGNEVKVLWYDDPSTNYPPLLAEIDESPVALFALGNAECLLRKPAMAIVGTRHATAYGVDCTEKLVKEISLLLPEKPLIVSGLAYGIDIAAHRAALETQAPTAAVLAHGLKTIYPAAHRSDAIKILEHGGVLITEYLSSAPIHRGNFLARNRIVAGICDLTCVMESDVRGGALATARLAMAYNRDVFALPGRVTDKYSSGCNALIRKQVASILSDAEHLCEAMRWQRRDIPVQASLIPQWDAFSPLEQKIVDLLTYHGQLQMSQLQEALEEPTHQVLATMVDLEFRGVVASLPGTRFRLATKA